MLSANNGTPQQCVRNLLSIAVGENPYERCKGISADVTDQPSTMAAGEIATEVSWCLEQYEPRVEEEDIALVVEDFMSGNFFLNAEVNTED